MVAVSLIIFAVQRAIAASALQDLIDVSGYLPGQSSPHALNLQPADELT